MSDVSVLNYDRDFLEGNRIHAFANTHIGGLIGRLYISPTAYSEDDVDPIPAGKEAGDTVPILLTQFTALESNVRADAGTSPPEGTPAAAISEDWDNFVWMDDPETIRRVVPWMTVVGDSIPAGATFGVRMYRNQGAGWQLLAANTPNDSYPADGLMSRTDDGYEFADPFSVVQSPITNHGRAADVAISNDLLDVPPPNALRSPPMPTDSTCWGWGGRFCHRYPATPRRIHRRIVGSYPTTLSTLLSMRTGSWYSPNHGFTGSPALRRRG